MTEVNSRTSHSKENGHLASCISSNMQNEPVEGKSKGTSVFVNCAAISWDESRRKWMGESSQKLQRTPKDPVISWSTTYEDLLSTNDPFSQKIPLPEMVDFLVDIWHDEGLFD
ncbi:uncharacterized protein LOC127251293 isoform X2 [Andrographis paniculata]|uniref:uncharacterized protein LOC127251293 isoform X2 n=1 Tax=Andrographis paniculata TaxID=175694 RepID=UPI0021E9AA0F|nr:uncharacterized protein LOC127251293 isoform X2 [Andrographis paniculata]XP_051130896.1 uncharacterized protein LOC127251293 isoform X2 [Andrographis paniculata]XP_051130897.1 uncharacterized protein LOC127251293 isoform X2 [Andrographis paniculata]